MYTVKNPFKLFFFTFQQTEMEHKFNADDLFVLIEDLSQTFPLNLKCEIKDKRCPDFCGPGMYFMYYKDELV